MRNAPQGLIAVTLFAVASLVGWAGCSSSSGSPSGSLPQTITDGNGPKHHKHHAGPYGTQISHIFIIIQENRSLNDLFAGANITGANTTTSGYEETASGGKVSVPLIPEPIATSPDIDHCYYDAAAAINASGTTKPMDGFNNEFLGDSCGQGSQMAGTHPYAYVQPGPGVQPYWDIANNWVLASNFFPTEMGPSFVAHLNLIAGTTEYKTNPTTAVADFPNSAYWGCQDVTKHTVRWLTATATPGPYTGPLPCYDQFHTIADDLDCLYCPASGSESPVPWKFYASTYGGGYIWSAFQAIKRVYEGTDWKNDVIPSSGQVLKDIPAGNLDKTGVVWITPQFAWSDHAGTGSTDEGASWVGDIVNAIGARTTLWDHSVIVVLWDDWGGWYDPAAPPTLDFRGYGIRTPMLIISPWDNPGQTVGHVSQEQFEPGSILRFIEQVFNMPNLGSLPCNEDYYYYYGCNLGYTDATANSIGDVLNVGVEAPRPFGTPIPTKYPPSKFEKGGSGYYYSDTAPDGE